MNVRFSFGFAALILGACAASPAQSETTKTSSRAKPNIVLIVSDDHGYADLGAAGAKDIKTPHLDALARNGVRFTNGYVTCPICSPTRAGLLTGRYQNRFGHEVNPGPKPAANYGLPEEEKTLANYLKEAGYVTGAIGKWHLGYREECRPQKRGFDEFFGFLGGAHTYDVSKLDKNQNALRRGDTPIADDRYLTYAFNDEATSFIESHKSEPFFLYLAYNAIHTPLEPAPRHLEAFAGIKNEKRRVMASMLAAVDEGVGRVVETLRSNGLEDDTLIFFISDNGGPTLGNGSRNDPLNGGKGSTLEGGIRVPFLVQWKGSLPAGEIYEKPVISLDILPTILAAAGTTATTSARLDGVDLAPYLSGANDGAPHESLFWRYGRAFAVRSGDWKLVGLHGGLPRLYNLVQDVSEKNDLAAARPEKVRTLQAEWDAWNRENVAPKWMDSRSIKRAAANDAAGGKKKSGEGRKGKKAKKRAPDARP